MGCCASSVYTRRVYRDPADLDEEIVPLRYFGRNRAGSNLVPDDVKGLPSCHIREHLASDPDQILYEADMDGGYAFRCLRVTNCCLFTPWGILYMLSTGCMKVCSHFTCEEACCYVRKEYSTRRYMRVYPNRIEVNDPNGRFPWGYCGCGSWAGDNIVAHPFDRGAFGFQTIPCGTASYFCCCWPVYGGAVARHRCQCNGPIWNRSHTDCGGWWCEEWLCRMLCCVYDYAGVGNPEETAFACSIALQCYFEGRTVTKEDMDKCIAFWRENIAEYTDPVNRKRAVCCEPFYVPWPQCLICHRMVHPERVNPYSDDETTDALIEAYANYADRRQKQINMYEQYTGAVHNSTVCRSLGCRKFFGRGGFCFCTEGLCAGGCDRKATDPAPPFEDHYFDDDWDASTVLETVIGPPPPNVVIRRWRWDPEMQKNVLHESPEVAPTETKLHDK